MNPIIQDPIGALRAAVESHQRYTELTGRELDCITLHPEHARQLVKVFEDLQHPLCSVVSVSIVDGQEADSLAARLREMMLKPNLLMPLHSGGWIRPSTALTCQHAVTSKFTSTGEVYCHDCRQTFTGNIEKHRRSSTMENS